MKAKIICILVMTLLIATSLPAMGVTNNDEVINEKLKDYGYLKKSLLYNSYISENWSEQDKLNASDGNDGDLFGVSISIDGDYAIVGSYRDNSEMGAAYVFKRDGTVWTEEQKLIASDGADYDNFGVSVSINGDYAIVGAYGDDGTGSWTGSAYIYKRSGTIWTQEAKLIASDGDIEDHFGVSVSIDGDYAIVGAYRDRDNGYWSGSAYIFKRDGTSWIEQTKLLSNDGEALDRFGWSVSIDGDYAIIGANYDDIEKGSVYVFKRDGTNWIQEEKLIASDGYDGDRFGCSVSIDGDYAIVGSYHDNSEMGAAYVFKRDGTVWTEEQKLIASDGADYDNFGVSVSIDGDYAIVGAYGNDDNGAWSGSAYIFKYFGTVWVQLGKLIPSDNSADDHFGISVSIDGIYAIIGAYRDNSWKGSAYVFVRDNNPPDAPAISGPTNGKPGTSYIYTFTSTDPDGDDIAEYIVNWGDGQDETITGPFPSGTPQSKGHTWTSHGTFTIKAKAKDIHGAESEWAEFTVTMPRNKATYRPLLQFLQSHPNLFPILQKLILQRFGL